MSYIYNAMTRQNIQFPFPTATRGTKTMEPRKEAICNALAAWIRQRPGLEFANYGDATSYRAEQRSIARDKRQALELLRVVSAHDGITADDLMRAARSAYSGRLMIKLRDGHGRDCAPWIEYCTGQYWPTEYRRAACAVLASALWEWQRENMPAPIGYRAQSWMQPSGTRARDVMRATREEAQADVDRHGGDQWGSVSGMYPGDITAGEWLRATFRKEFGKGLASRWFQ